MTLRKYRMYVDEVGNHDLDARQRHPNERYLSLTGVIIDLDHVRDFVSPEIERLKQVHFGSHPDDPVVFHRREMVNRDPPFHALKDPTVNAAFDADLLALVTGADYLAITAVIDKWEHLSRYGDWTRDPYHYCMEVLVERFVLHLRRLNGVGDVMAEARGGNEDMRLKKAFTDIYEQGTLYIPAPTFKNRLTSRQIKLERKTANRAGLQLADLIAYPAYRYVLAKKNNQALPATFSAQIASVLDGSKFCRSSAGKIEGWGTKWLP
jgi:hypothetical protein